MSCFQIMCSLLLSVTLSLRLTHHKPEPVKLWTEMDREEKMWRYYLWSLSHYCHTLPSWSVVTNPVTCSELWCWKPAVSMSRALSLFKIKSIPKQKFPSPALLLTVQGMLTVWLQDSDWRPSVGEQDWVWWWVWSLSTDTGVRVQSTETRVTFRQSHRHWSPSLSS